MPDSAQVHLLLSGGGFRATLFHLGVLRFLYEYRQKKDEDEKCGLHDIRLVSGVSGGSITAAHFVANCERYRRSFLDPAKELVHFTTNVDLRREVLRNGKSVAQVLSEKLFKQRFLINSTPKDLELVILGTSLKTGNCIAFNNSSIESLAFDPNSSQLKVIESAALSSICVTNLIHASAAFPPFFSPLYIDRSIFVSKPTLQELKTLAGEEVADGGIRDNLGLDWYVAKNSGDQNSLLVVSDAGQAFDWDRSNNTAQSVNTWINRLMRAVNIQMMRLSQLDKSKQVASPNIVFIGFESRKELSTLEDFKNSVVGRAMTAGVGAKAVEISTDLVPIPPAQTYAIVRLGYDIAKLKLSAKLESTASVNGRLNSEDGFWEFLKPGNVSQLSDDGSKDHETSLEFLIEKETNSRSFRWYNVVGYYDIWLQIPLRNRNRRLLTFSAIALLALSIFGAWTATIGGIRIIAPYFQTRNEVTFSRFFESVRTISWEDACKQIQNRKVTVRGKLLSKRGAVITIQLDRLQELAKVRLLDSTTSSALPTDPDENRPYFLTLDGLYSGDEPHPAILNLIEGSLLNTLESRPIVWDE